MHLHHQPRHLPPVSDGVDALAYGHEPRAGEQQVLDDQEGVPGPRQLGLVVDPDLCHLLAVGDLAEQLQEALTVGLRPRLNLAVMTTASSHRTLSRAITARTARF